LQAQLQPQFDAKNYLIYIRISFIFLDTTSSILSTNSAIEETKGLQWSYTQSYKGETVGYTIKVSTSNLTWKSNFKSPKMTGWHHIVIKWNKRWGILLFKDGHSVINYNRAGLPTNNRAGVQRLVLGNKTGEWGQENLQIHDFKYWPALLARYYVYQERGKSE
jgi:hypothetical protein